MSISYQPKDADVSSVQLKVQELVLTQDDNAVVSGAGTTTVVINFKEYLASNGSTPGTFSNANPNYPIRSVTHKHDSTSTSYFIPTSAQVIAANSTSTGNQVTLTLSAALLINDVIVINFITAE